MKSFRSFLSTPMLRLAVPATLFIWLSYDDVEGPLKAAQEQISQPSDPQIEAIAGALRQLTGRELEVLEHVLTKPDWSQKRRGDQDLVAALSAAVVREGDEGRIERLLGWVGDEAGQPQWRRLAILNGVETALRESPDINPQLFAGLRRVSEVDIRDRVSQLLDNLRWSLETEDQSATTGRPLTDEEQILYDTGKREFQGICAACHLESGVGTPGLAPPLVNSQWVLGPDKFLAMIILQGKEGSPGYPPMPPLRGLDDHRIAAILTYIRRVWGHQASPVKASMVAEVRVVTAERAKAWRERELKLLLQENSRPQN